MKKKNGSVLIWSLTLILIFSVFVLGAVTIASKMSSRSIKNNISKQLVLTSESAVEIVAQALINNTDGLLDYVLDGSEDKVTDDFFPEKATMGKCQVTVHAENDGKKIYIQAVTTKDDMSETVSLVMVDSGNEYIKSRYSNSNIETLVSEENE